MILFIFLVRGREVSTKLPKTLITDNQQNIKRRKCNITTLTRRNSASSSDINLISGRDNGGWAMSPDQSCFTRSWCPYACRSGFYSTQYDPLARCTQGPGCGSMNGGIYCSEKAEVVVPFPNEPLCKRGVASVKLSVASNWGEVEVQLCQTVYPGNEAMLIPTLVRSKPSPTTNNVDDGVMMLNVPPRDYWMNTSAHYYINKPTHADKGKGINGCVWGSAKEPVGNWAPFVMGAGQGGDGRSYVSLKWNPLFVEESRKPTNKNGKFSKEVGFRIDIFPTDKGGGVHGLPCSVGPNTQLDSMGCTVTVEKGRMAVVEFSKA